MRHHGVTLIELLLVMAIIGALLALVFPMMSSRLDERSFVSTADQLRAQLLLARAEAMRTGVPLEVVFLEDEALVEVRRFEVGGGGSGGLAAGGRVGGALSDSFADNESFATSRPSGGGGVAASRSFGAEEDEDLVYDASWATLPLASGTRLVHVLPDMFDPDLAANAPMPGIGAQGGTSTINATDGFDPLGGSTEWLGGDAAPLRVTVFLGDGSSLLNRSLWLVDAGGRRMKVEINPWTGIASLTREPDASQTLAAARDPFSDTAPGEDAAFDVPGSGSGSGSGVDRGREGAGERSASSSSRDATNASAASDATDTSASDDASDRSGTSSHDGSMSDHDEEDDSSDMEG